MPKVRVLIVDDSVVIRRIVSDIISGDPDLEVAGVAANGRIALDRIPQVNPDIITLDVEMPEMDGLQMLKELRKTYPRTHIVPTVEPTGKKVAIVGSGPSGLTVAGSTMPLPINAIPIDTVREKPDTHSRKNEIC